MHTSKHTHCVGVRWPQLPWSVVPLTTLLARTCSSTEDMKCCSLSCYVYASTCFHATVRERERGCVGDLMVSMRPSCFQMLLNLFLYTGRQHSAAKTDPCFTSGVAQKPLKWTQRTVHCERHLCWQSLNSGRVACSSLVASKPRGTCSDIQSYVATQRTVIRASTLQPYQQTLRKLVV